MFITRSFRGSQIIRTLAHKCVDSGKCPGLCCSKRKFNQITPRGFWLSKSSASFSSKSVEESKNSVAGIKPLSSLSEQDAKLAVQAAKDDEESTPQSNVSMNIDQIPGTSKGGSRKLAIIFTCNICNTRSAKKFTERAYNHGVVLVRCPKCNNLHLIADRLGYFSDKNDDKGWDIEMFMKSIGKEDNIKVVTEGQEVLELTMRDVLGPKDAKYNSSNDPANGSST